MLEATAKQFLKTSRAKNLFCLPPVSADLPQFLGAVSLASLDLCRHADVWMCSSVLVSARFRHSCTARHGSSQRNAVIPQNPQRSQNRSWKHTTAVMNSEMTVSKLDFYSWWLYRQTSLCWTWMELKGIIHEDFLIIHSLLCRSKIFSSMDLLLLCCQICQNVQCKAFY